MVELQRLRSAHQRLALRTISQDPRHPLLFVNQTAMMTRMGEYCARPSRPIEPWQDLDPDSPTLGGFPFMADFDGADSSAVL